MNRMSKFFGATALGLTALALASTRGTAADDDPAMHDPNHATVSQMERTVGGAVQAGRLDEKTSGANIRASQLIGMSVQNAEEDNLGTVNDIVLNTATGRMRYVAVSYGGFLGMGNKLFAIPWGAFRVQQAKDSDEYLLVLDVNEEKIKKAPGFDQDHWPNFADREFTGGIDVYYGVGPRDIIGRRPLEGRRSVDVNVGPGGVEVNADRKPPRSE